MKVQPTILTLFQWTKAQGLHAPREWGALLSTLAKPDRLAANPSSGVWVAMWRGESVIDNYSADGEEY